MWHHLRQPVSGLLVPHNKWLFSNPPGCLHRHSDLLFSLGNLPPMQMTSMLTTCPARWIPWKYPNLSVCKIKRLRSAPPVSLCLLMISPSSQSPKTGSSFLSLTILLSLPKSKSVSKKDLSFTSIIPPSTYPCLHAHILSQVLVTAVLTHANSSNLVTHHLSRLKWIHLLWTLQTDWHCYMHVLPHSMDPHCLPRNPRFSELKELASDPTIHSFDLGSSSNSKHSGLTFMAIPALAPI